MALFNKNPAQVQAGDTNIPISQVLNMKSRGYSNNQIANHLRTQGYSLSQIRDSLSQAEIKSAVQAPEPEENMPRPPAPPRREYAGPAPGAQMQPMPQEPGEDELDLDDDEDEINLPDMPELPGSQGMGAPEPQRMPAMPRAPSMSAPEPQGLPQMPEPPEKHEAGAAMPRIDKMVDELQRIIEQVIEEKWGEVEDRINELDVWKSEIDTKLDNFSQKVDEMTRRIDLFSKEASGRTEDYQKTVEDVGVQMEAMEKMMGKLVPSLAEEIKELRSIVGKIKKK